MDETLLLKNVHRVDKSFAFDFTNGNQGDPLFVFHQTCFLESMDAIVQTEGLSFSVVNHLSRDKHFYCLSHR